MAAYVELYIDQGANFTNIINVTDDVTNAYINVYGYTVTSQLRRSYYSANASANIVCTVTNSSNGEITLTMTSANTANLKPGRYLFDVETISTTNVTSRILEGVVSVTPGVTR
jgi:hypothetical protein